MIIKCKLGETIQTIGGVPYAFAYDQAGRAACVVNNAAHQAMFLGTGCYEEVEPLSEEAIANWRNGLSSSTGATKVAIAKPKKTAETTVVPQPPVVSDQPTLPPAFSGEVATATPPVDSVDGFALLVRADLEAMTKPELLELADTRGIAASPALAKNPLIDFLMSA